VRVVCGLVAATLAAVVYLGLGTHNARAGTPEGWEAAQLASTAASATAVPAQGVALYPTDTALPTAQAAAPDAKSPQMVVDDQTAGAQTSVTQTQPTNVVISIRIDSPGDNGPISQTNVAVGSANGTNDAANSQNGAAGGAGQSASTNQQAGANTTVNQDQAGNLVVTVRINSPGNNGPVSQTNAAAGSSNAQNSSETSQGGQTEAPAQSMAPAKAAGGSSKHASHRRPHHKRSALAATAPAATTPVGPAPAWHSSGAKAADAVRAHHPRHAVGGRAAHRGRAAAHRGTGEQASTSPLGKAISGAGDLLGTVAPHAPIGTPQRPADVSSPVLYSLLAALGVAAAFVAWSVRPTWRRQRRFGNWLFP
jgi:hypothetical protein